MIDKENLTEKIKKVFFEEFKILPTSLKPETQLYSDLGLDSIDAIDLVVRLEVETGLKLKAPELKSIRSFQDVVDVVHRELQKKG